MINDIACVILAGGKSSRMGQDKALLPFGKFDSLAKYQYEKFSKIFKNVYISAKENKFNFECNLILDRYKEYSPMHALSSIFETIDFENIFLISVDMPFFSRELVYKLKDNLNKDITLFKNYDKLEPFGAIYSKKIYTHISNMLENRDYKMKNLLNRCEINVISSNTKIDFININYMDDYKKHIKIS